jgi:hypothetical protein
MTSVEWIILALLVASITACVILFEKRRTAVRQIRSLLGSSLTNRDLLKQQLERQPDSSLRTEALAILEKSKAPLAEASVEPFKGWPDWAATYTLLDNDFRCSLEAARMLGVTVPRLQEYIVNSRTGILNSQCSAYQRSDAWSRLAEAQKRLNETIALLKQAGTRQDIRLVEQRLDEIEETITEAGSTPAPSEQS